MKQQVRRRVTGPMKKRHEAVVVSPLPSRVFVFDVPLVVEVVAKIPNGEKGVVGLLDWDAGKVYVSSRLSPVQQWLTLIHEMVHGFIALTEIERFARTVGRKKRITMSLDDLEELLASTVAGVLWSMGFEGENGVVFFRPFDMADGEKK